MDLSYTRILNDEAGFIDDGHYRDVWYVKETGQKPQNIVLKSLKYEHEVDSRNLDRNRRDALAMERLTFSNYVLNIYGFCANAGLNEYSQDGTLSSRIKKARTKKYQMASPEKIKIATHVATAVYYAHNSDREGQAAFTHGDIKADQFLNTHGIYKLNDFNRGRLLS